MNFSAYCGLLLGSIDYWQCTLVKCGRPGMSSSVTEAQSYDKDRGGRSITGVHGSVTGAQNKSVFKGHGGATSGQRSLMEYSFKAY